MDIGSYCCRSGSTCRLGGRFAPAKREPGEGDGLYDVSLRLFGHGSSTGLASTATVGRSCSPVGAARSSSSAPRQSFRLPFHPVELGHGVTFRGGRIPAAPWLAMA